METLALKHGSLEAAKEWLRTIGAKGGQGSRTGGFYKNKELARKAGAKGGRISRRKSTTHCPQGHEYTADSVYWHVSAIGTRVRYCRICSLERSRRQRMREESTNA